MVMPFLYLHVLSQKHDYKIKYTLTFWACRNFSLLPSYYNNKLMDTKKYMWVSEFGAKNGLTFKRVLSLYCHTHRHEPQDYQVSLIISLRKKTEILVPWLRPLTTMCFCLKHLSCHPWKILTGPGKLAKIYKCLAFTKHPISFPLSCL